MAGHSKWKNIKHKKAIIDAKKAKRFTRLLKDISVSAKAGGGDLISNSHLRLLVQKANEMNMPKDNYIKAIKRGTGELKSATYEQIFYEGYGTEEVAIIIEVLTDNKNRAVSELRTAFSHNGGRLIDNGCLSWMFEKTGIIVAENNCDNRLNEESIFELLIDFNIQNIDLDDNILTIMCSIDSINKIQEILIKNNFIIDESHVGFYRKEQIEIPEDKEESVSNFLSIIENLDDVQHVYTNI